MDRGREGERDIEARKKNEGKIQFGIAVHFNPFPTQKREDDVGGWWPTSAFVTA